MEPVEERVPMSHFERLWDAGERHLVAGRYVAARRELEGAEAVAWRHRDGVSLSRIYLPLMEARRQIRLNAAEGMLVISGGEARTEREQLSEFMRQEAGTFLLSGLAPDKAAGSVQYAARHRGSCLESLLLMQHKGETRLVSPANPHFAGGLPVRPAGDAGDLVDPQGILRGEAAVPLPPAGVYVNAGGTKGYHALIRESLLVAWEALALKWQARHPLRPTGPSSEAAWEELAWLRLALRVDPACEPVAMRIMSLAEAVEKGPGGAG